MSLSAVSGGEPDFISSSVLPVDVSAGTTGSGSFAGSGSSLVVVSSSSVVALPSPPPVWGI